MPKIRFYHIRTLLLTYLVWTPLNLLLAYALWHAVSHPMGQVFRAPEPEHVSYLWVLLQLHILPLYGLIRTLWEGNAVGFIFFLPEVIAGFAVFAGLLIKQWWARFFIIIGISIWFFLSFCILGLSV